MQTFHFRHYRWQVLNASCGFSPLRPVVDPAGNSVIFIKREAHSATGDDERKPGEQAQSRLAKAVDKAAKLRDQKGDAAAAAKAIRRLGWACRGSARGGEGGAKLDYRIALPTGSFSGEQRTRPMVNGMQREAPAASNAACWASCSR